MKHLIFAFVVAASLAVVQTCMAQTHFVHGGDGVISIRSAQSGQAFAGRYRNDDGSYDNAALMKIDRVFGAPAGATEPRLIEFLDHIQDVFGGGLITVTSGYRSPTYNTSLRTKGRIAGKASMHQYGMAADLRMKGTHPEKVWHYVRELGYGGAGYYHGANVHLDVGPARFWDETSSKVGTDHADDNKLITLIQDRDFYAPGSDVVMRFVRMTAYPIGVDRTFALEKHISDTWKTSATFTPRFATTTDGSCPAFSSIDAMKDIRWTLPQNMKPGRYRIRASFCDTTWDAMPDAITSYEFVVTTKNFKSLSTGRQAKPHIPTGND